MTNKGPHSHAHHRGSVRYSVVVRAGLTGGDSCFARDEKPTSPVCSDGSGGSRALPWGPPSPQIPLAMELRVTFVPGMRPIPRQPKGTFPMPSCQGSSCSSAQGARSARAGKRGGGGEKNCIGYQFRVEQPLLLPWKEMRPTATETPLSAT